ncbi:MAG: SHOCT domain-containing protein, partial [Clostridia bacterium]|nr:SHOCT domain-containing protein [Clostridia bacterium]
DEIKKYKELLDAGIISQEEFEEKKNDLLKK